MAAGSSPGGEAGGLRLRRCGERSWLVECGTASRVGRVYATVAGRDDVVEVVPGATTVLVETVTGAAPGGIDLAFRWVESDPSRPVNAPATSGGSMAVPESAAESAAGPVLLTVRYDGPDLDDVAAAVGLTVDEIVRRHQAPEYVVAFCGFSPGFGYLVGGDPLLAVPRRSSPRPTVPAGAVGLGGEFTGVYPRSSPGGWNLIGHTDALLWNPDRDDPALLAPGRRVRFVTEGG